jgi:hypothetical protein
MPMPRYLISFDDGAMDHIPDADWPAVGDAAHAVVRAATDVDDPVLRLVLQLDEPAERGRCLSPVGHDRGKQPRGVKVIVAA